MNSVSTIKVSIGMAALTFVAFMFISWPLPRYWNDGIPSSAQNIENPPQRFMIAGDHLQLLYHFDLVRDQITGRIPFLHNPYEFNQGDDDARFRMGSYFMPMSGVYALLSLVAGSASAWNITMWLSVWLSALFAWLWLRRFTDNGWAIALGLVIVLVSPFRWISLFGGSPSGIALMWVPLLAWSIDTVVRKPGFASGGWLGFSLLMLYWGDIHAFYFGVLSSPLFFLMSWAHSDSASLKRMPDFLKAVPGAFIGVAIIGFFFWWRHQYISASTMADGRDETELANYSASWPALFFGGGGKNDHLFIGFAAASVFLIAVFLALRDALKSRVWLRMFVISLVLVAIALGAILSLGIHGPLEGGLIKWARAYVPGYEMIRQPAKIFAVIPLLIAWMTAIGFSTRFAGGNQNQTGCRALVLVLGIVVGFETLGKVSATICLLDRSESAYDAIAKDAAAANQLPVRALALPIWPGDDKDTSVPLYYAHRLGIRLINGYSPVVPTNYFEGVFRELESINQGLLTDEQAKYLLDRGIRYVLVHENMYPEKVSPFPVATLLDRLKSHPRVAPLAQTGSIHAFKLLEQPATNVQLGSLNRFLLPARRFSPAFENGAAFRSRLYRIAPGEDYHWWIRTRGEGDILVNTYEDNTKRGEQRVQVSSLDWSWHLIPFPILDAYAPVRLELIRSGGDVDADHVLLSDSQWPLTWNADRVTIPAADFFRAGYTLDDGRSVQLRADFEPDTVVFYGPGMPVEPGTYELDVEFSSDAPAGTKLATWRVKVGLDMVAEMPVHAGDPLKLTWTAASNLPVNGELHFNRIADMTLHAVHISRLDGSMSTP